MKRVFPILIFILQFLLLTSVVCVWWAHRNNNLFNSHHWIFGKNDGKFVFYTYSYMFKPIEHGRINLNDAMGNQEILYHIPEDETRSLSAIEFDAALSENAYLWIELHKDGMQMLACRLSNFPAYPSGFYHYDQNGYLQNYTPFTSTEYRASSQWSAIKIIKDEKHWNILENGILIGTVEDLLPAQGYVGVRGSGNIGAKVYVKDISLTFQDPADPNRVEKFKESFDSSPFRGSLLKISGILVLFILLLRFFRQKLFLSGLSHKAAGLCLGIDNASFIGLLILVLILPVTVSGVHIPALLVLGEFIGLICFIAVRLKMKEDVATRQSSWYAIVGLVAISILFSASFARHGEWLGRSDRTVWSWLKNVHPSAFVTYPQEGNRLENYVLEEPVDIQPANPFFTDGKAFRDQVVEVQFTIPEDCTFDIVWQQQSFMTKGDQDGEKLPLQRRRLRLSTYENIPWGLASGTRTQAFFYYRLNGELKKDTKNSLKIHASGEGIEVVLNGIKTKFEKIPNLGFGETGFMALDKTVRLHKVQVSRIDGIEGKVLFWPVVGFLVPYLLCYILSLFLFVLGLAGNQNGLRLTLAVLIPPSMYLIMTFPLSSSTLSYLSHFRYGWLDLVLFGAVLSMFYLFAFGKMARKWLAPLVSNVFMLILIGLIGLFVWDIVLPENHSLRLRFAKGSIAPAGKIQASKRLDGPWYAHDKLTQANTYLWHQKFNGESIEPVASEEKVRIFTMGGSQAWGSGAADSSSTYAELLEKDLQNKGYPVEIFNAGINGSGITQVYYTFRGLISSFSPDMLILDVGLNDSYALHGITDEKSRDKHRKRLLKDVQSIVDLCNEEKVALVVVLEAMNREVGLGKDVLYYDGLREIGRSKGGTIIDAYSHFERTQRNNIYWWDPAHFSPAGHRALSDLMAPVVAGVLPKKRSQIHETKH